MTTPQLDDAPLDEGPPPPPPPAPAPPAARRGGAGDRFFGWTSGLGIVRGDGWIGGVAAGIAARLRIDPLIVRGVFVVVGLFGFPILLLYGLAWALLPDLDDRIPLRDALRGQVTPALLGAGAAVLLGLIPSPLVWLIGGSPIRWYDGPSALVGIALIALAAVIVAGLLFVIVRAAVHAPYESAPAVSLEQRTASAAPATSDESAAESGSGPDPAPADVEGVDAAGFAASTSPAEDEYAAWREQHAAWKAQDDAWRRQQQDASRAARDQARRERHDKAAAFSAEASERRRLRRASSPRTPFAFVATVVGIAIVAGALVAVTSDAELAGSLGLFVAALVVALGMVVAGLARRRSGFLAFTTILLLAGGLGATAAPAVAALHLGSYSLSNAEEAPAWPADAPFEQPWGDVFVSLMPADEGSTTRPIHIEKGSGGTYVTIEPGVTLVFDITAPSRSVGVLRGAEGEFASLGDLDEGDLEDVTRRFTGDGRVRLEGTLPAAPQEGVTPTLQKIVIDQRSGYISIEQYATEVTE